MPDLRMFGSGMLRNAAEDQQLYPEYQKQMMEAQMNGQPFPKFEEWKQMQMKMQLSQNNQF